MKTMKMKMPMMKKIELKMNVIKTMLAMKKIPKKI
jgi:hypothetical protein